MRDRNFYCASGYCFIYIDSMTLASRWNRLIGRNIVFFYFFDFRRSKLLQNHLITGTIIDGITINDIVAMNGYISVFRNECFIIIHCSRQPVEFIDRFKSDRLFVMVNRLDSDRAVTDVFAVILRQKYRKDKVIDMVVIA